MTNKVKPIARGISRKVVPKYEFLAMDCLDYLGRIRAGAVDLVLTDPPYEISRDTNFASGKPTGKDSDRFRVSMDFGHWDSLGEEAHSKLMRDFAFEMYRTLRSGGTAIVWYDYWKIESLKKHLSDAGFRMFRLLSWEKTNPVPLNADRSFLSNSREQAIYCVKGSKPTFNDYYHAGIFRLPIPRENRFHPTQKPLALMKECVSLCSKEGDTVLDPFAGSATSLVAALELGRNALGCELDVNYFNQASRRLLSLELPTIRERKTA